MAQVRETAQWNEEGKAHVNVWHTRLRNYTLLELCRPAPHSGFNTPAANS
jgi:hypothetical protein